MAREELIDLNANLAGFFNEAVGEAVRARECAASDSAVYYLVGLLADYARPDTLKRACFDQPFTLLLHEALQTEGPERFERLRLLGDDVLYVSGFFGHHLEHRGVELTFVANLGSRAYNEAAAILKRARGEHVGPDVFGELSNNFPQFVAVLSEVADVVQARSARTPRGMLDVYERWLRTGSVALAGALADWGVLPNRADGTLH